MVETSQSPASPDEADETGGPGAFVQPPQQERSRKTLERIAQAALELMAEVGPDRATVAEIVKRGRTSVGSFYARFQGKDDLIRYLQERVWSEARERWDEAMEREEWGALPVASVVEGVIGILFRTVRADFHARRVLGPARPGDEAAARRARAFHDHVLASITPLILARREEVVHPEPETALRYGYWFTVGAIREVLEMEGAPEDWVREMARAWTAYLAGGPDGYPDAPDGEVDFFDPWG